MEYILMSGHNWNYKLHLKCIKSSGYLVNSLNVEFYCKIPKMFKCTSEKMTVVMWLMKKTSVSRLIC